MNKLFAAAALAVLASAASVQTASAWLFIPWSPLHGEATSVGDAFQPSSQTASESDMRALCEEKGGELKKRFNGQDFEFVCVG